MQSTNVTRDAGAPTASSRVAVALYALCLAVAVVWVTYALFGDYRYTFHSDGALKTILARQAWIEGRIIPREWVYANGDLFFVGPQIFAELLYPFTGMGYFNNALADWLSYAFLVAASLWTGRAVLGHWRGGLLTGVLVASGLCAASFEFTIAQGAYSMWAALALLLGAGIAHASTTSWRGSVRGWLWLTGSMLLGLLGALCNPARGVISIVVPALVGWGAYCLFHTEGSLSRRLRRAWHPVVLAVIVGTIIGLLANRFVLMPGVNNFNAAARIGISSPADMLKHVHMLPYAWFDYIRVGASWPSLTPWRRFLQLCLWGLAIAMAVSPIAIVLRAVRYRPAVVAFAWITLATFGIAVAALVVAPSLFLGTGELRYLTFGMLNALVTVVAVVLPTAAPGSGRSRVAALVAIFAALLASQWSVESHPDSGQLGGTYTRRMELIHLLESEHVGTFISSYWYSHVVTVLSNGAVEGYPVMMDPVVGPFAHHMPRYIHPGTAGSRQAVVLDKSEVTPEHMTRILDTFGQPVSRQSTPFFDVLIYNTDIASLAMRPSGIDTPVDPARLAVAVSPSTVPSCAGCTVSVSVTNLGAETLTSAGLRPLVLGIYAVDASGERLHGEGRGYFRTRVSQGRTGNIDVQVPPTSPEGTVAYRVCLVQEMVAWRCERTQAAVPAH